MVGYANSRSRAPWNLSAPVRREGGRRAEATLDGRRLAFWSDASRIADAPEAFAGPLLLAAMKARAGIRPAASLDADWVGGTRQLAKILARWWRWPARYPLVGLRERDDTATRDPRRGLCFTAGVDSFYALLSDRGRYDHLVYVHGLDVRLDDYVRRRAVEVSLGAVAAALGVDLHLVATNARSLAAIERVGWGRMHGAVLAAIGHALRDEIGELTIAPSWHTEGLEPWGSHPDADVLWSSRRMRIRHGNASLPRSERTRAIARHPVVQAHLRVCWENRAPTGNCSRCEKCLRTMATLAALGCLDAFTVFADGRELERRLDALREVPRHVVPLWQEILALDPPPILARRIRDLLDRTVRGAPVS